MDSYEKDASNKGFTAIAGVDEAGRGPLAGPVVAAAVIFSKPPTELGIKDSKALTPVRRASLVFDIYRTAEAVGVGFVWPSAIDSLNIHKASLLAMEKAVDNLSMRPDLLLIDGAFAINSKAAQWPIISGDSLSVTIAAASIIAKTARDSVMRAYHGIFPQFNFMSNKGYPTKDHFLALSENGPAPIHRRSFRGVIALKGGGSR